MNSLLLARTKLLNKSSSCRWFETPCHLCGIRVMVSHRLFGIEHIYGLVEDCSYSSALALELLQSCTNPLISCGQDMNMCLGVCCSVIQDVQYIPSNIRTISLSFVLFCFYYRSYWHYRSYLHNGDINERSFCHLIPEAPAFDPCFIKSPANLWTIHFNPLTTGPFCSKCSLIV